MSVVAWPAGVPSRIRLPFSGGPQESRAAFEPEIGGPITRRKTTVAPEVYDFIMEPLTRSEFIAWRAWFRDTLNYGQNDFSLSHPLTGSDGTWRIMPGSQPYQTEIDGLHIRLGFRALLVKEVSNTAPVNTVAPSISGLATVGATLNGNPGTWTGIGIAYSYEWLVNGVVAGTGLSFTATPGTITFRVTATNVIGAVTVTSAAVVVTGSGAGTAALRNADGTTTPLVWRNADGTTTNADWREAS